MRYAFDNIASRSCYCFDGTNKVNISAGKTERMSEAVSHKNAVCKFALTFIISRSCIPQNVLYSERASVFSDAEPELVFLFSS